MTLIFNTIIPLLTMGILNYLIYKAMRRSLKLNRHRSSSRMGNGQSFPPDGGTYSSQTRSRYIRYVNMYVHNLNVVCDSVFDIVEKVIGTYIISLVIWTGFSKVGFRVLEMALSNGLNAS